MNDLTVKQLRQYLNSLVQDDPRWDDTIVEYWHCNKFVQLTTVAIEAPPEDIVTNVILS